MIQIGEIRRLRHTLRVSRYRRSIHGLKLEASSRFSINAGTILIKLGVIETWRFTTGHDGNQISLPSRHVVFFCVNECKIIYAYLDVNDEDEIYFEKIKL